MARNNRKDERQAEPKRGAARNIAAAAGGLTLGGLAQQETLQGLIHDDSAPDGVEPTITDSSLDVFDELDATYQHEHPDAGGDADPALPDLDFDQSVDSQAHDLEPVEIPPVEIETPSIDPHPLDDVASAPETVDEFVDEEIRFEMDNDDEDDLGLEIVL